ncbi:hypothetical protein KI387_039482, partial [Taxus chinensis]
MHACRSYKSGYVWNDLSEEDIICPADGVEYVLKGSELFEGCSEKYQEATSNKTSNTKHVSEGTMVTQSCVKSTVPKNRTLIESPAENPHETGHKLPIAQNVCASQPKVITREEDIGNISTRSEPPHYRPRVEKKPPKSCLREYKVLKCEAIETTVTLHGADAATQTSEDLRREEEGQEDELKESECTQNSTELSGGEESPRSSSSISSAAETHGEAQQTKQIKKTVRFEEPSIINQASSRFSLLQLISCGSLGVEDNNILMVPQKPARHAGGSQGQVPIDSRNKNQSHSKVAADRTLGEELDCMAEDLRIAHAQSAEREYFSGSIVEMKTQRVKAESEGDPTLTKSSSYNAERGSKSELAGVAEKERDESRTKTKCIPKNKWSKKATRSRTVMDDRNSKGSS